MRGDAKRGEARGGEGRLGEMAYGGASMGVPTGAWTTGLCGCCEDCPTCEPDAWLGPGCRCSFVQYKKHGPFTACASRLSRPTL